LKTLHDKKNGARYHYPAPLFRNSP